MNKIEIVIRPPTSDDVEELKQMMEYIWRETYPDINAGISLEDVEHLFEQQDSMTVEERKQKLKDRLADSTQLRRVATVNSRIVGQLGVVKTDEKQDLTMIYVHPDFHGKGVAQKLMEEADAWFETDRSVSVSVAKHNARAIAFYEKYGFKIVDGSEKEYEKLPMMKIIDMERSAR